MEPKAECEEAAFVPAELMFGQKVAGRVKFDDITLEKGVLQDGLNTAALDWIKQEVDANTVIGQLSDEHMHEHRAVRPRRTADATLGIARRVD